MKSKFLLTALIPSALLFAGCESNGLSPREQHNSYAAMINSLYRATPGGTTNQAVALPVQLAVAQIGEVAPEASFVSELAKDPALVRRVVPLPMPGERPSNNGYVPNPDRTNCAEKLATEVESVRNLARAGGAQYLLLVGGSIDSFDSRTPLAPLDLTIIGAAVAPGVRVNSDGKAASALLEVETGRILLLANAQVKLSGLTPAFYSTERRESLNAQLRGELLKKLAGNFLENLKQLPAPPATIR